MIGKLNRKALFYFAGPLVFLFFIVVICVFAIWLATILGGLTDLRSIVIFMICMYLEVALSAIVLDRIFQRLMHG